MKTYLVFWTYSANYADKFARFQVKELADLAHDINSRYAFYSDKWFHEVKFHIIEVGGDVVFEGSWIELRELK
jgi:uncharacterized protein (DUF2126 family)